MLTRLVSATFQRKVHDNLAGDLFASCFQRSHLLLNTLYTATSLILVWLYFGLILKTTLSSNHPRQQRHGAQQINLERLFLSIYAIVLGLSYSMYRIFRQVWVIDLQVIEQDPWYLIKIYAKSLNLFSFLWASGTFISTYFFYLISSGFFYRLTAVGFRLYTTVLDTPVIGFRWWDVCLFFKMVMVGWIMIKAWTFVDLSVDAYFNRVEDCLSSYSNPFEILIDGLRFQKDDRIRGLAFRELVRLSSVDDEKRKILYNDLGDKDVSSMWYRIKTECLIVIDELINRIKDEYKTDKKKDELKDKETKISKSFQQKKKVIKLVDNNVYAGRQKNITELDDRTNNVLIKMTTRISDAIPSPDIHIGKLTKTVIDKYAPKRLFGITRTNGWLAGNIVRLTQQNRKMYSVFGNVVLPIASIEALSNILSFSLKEDDLGQVQYDLSLIINTLLECSSTVDNYINSPPPQYNPPFSSSDLPLLAPYQLMLAVDSAILHITSTFKDHIQDIKVNEQYISIWERLVGQ
ncbi:nucleoporin protein Ndc1-Nup [Halteromyces radiatus]|uniref:nucleoporin protein Ndc1-Nup n=1 Tax=Halteromyces radiatus TaxID=101107 RepID=UPI00221ED6FC|nr:nucleoporin protein Ndc1-Nup [Halteromyces radiatus]KAI8093906.1 nucleoporin protein Ndc1-Nup [Halteromyces radiatus]